LGQTANDLAVSPDGGLIFAMQSNAADPYGAAGQVTVISTATTSAVGSPVAVGVEPGAAAVSADGSFLYLANYSDSTVSAVDLTTMLVTTIPVGAYPSGLAISPDGTRVYVTNQGSGTVSVIATASLLVTDTFAAAAQPVGIAISFDGATLYIPHYAGYPAGALAIVDTGTHAVTSLALPNAPTGIAISPSGAALYVTHQGANPVGPGTLTVVDTASAAVTGSIAVGNSPFRVAVSPDGATAYVPNFNSASVSVVTFSPGIPPAPTAVAGDGEATITVTPPTSGGTPSSYTVTSAPGGFSCTVTGAGSCTIPGLTNGTTYTFTATATNAAGTSAPSPESNAVTPHAAPSLAATGFPAAEFATAGAIVLSLGVLILLRVRRKA
jgi:YVTN family beta-propeller protein